MSTVCTCATAALILASSSACAFSAAALSAAALACCSAIAFAVSAAACLAVSASSFSNSLESMFHSFVVSLFASTGDSSPLADSNLGANCSLKELNSSSVLNDLDKLNSVF